MFTAAQTHSQEGSHLGDEAHVLSCTLYEANKIWHQYVFYWGRGRGPTHESQRFDYRTCSLHVHMSLGKPLNPTLLSLISVWVCNYSWWAGGALHGSLCHQCVNGWMLNYFVKLIEWSLILEKLYINSPFTEVSVIIMLLLFVSTTKKCMLYHYNSRNKCLNSQVNPWGFWANWCGNMKHVVFVLFYTAVFMFCTACSHLSDWHFIW